jgi:GcrA cell cycle regulator
MAAGKYTTWNAETEQTLRTLWDEGLSAAAIGRRIGVAKNSIIGKARRLKLTPRLSPIKREPGPHSRVKRGPRAPRAVAAPEMPRVVAVKPVAHVWSRFTAPMFVADPMGTRHPNKRPILLPENTARLQLENQRISDFYKTATSRNRPVIATDNIEAVANRSDAAMQAALDRVTMRERAPVKTVFRAAPTCECTWPIGEPRTPGFRYCDDVSLPGKPYCKAHCTLAYRPRTAREVGYVA